MQGKNSAPDTRSSWQRAQDLAARDPAVTAIVLYAVVALAAFIAAYFAIFTVFATYDDEGTLLITLKAFVHGDPLYKEIWSVYGPFYYELFGGFFKLFGITITTDASRSIVLVLWVGASLLVGVASQKITGRLSIGLAAMVSAFAALSILTNEPMHPQGLCVVLIGALVLVAATGGNRRGLASGAGCGVLLAALLLTKVNLGVFAIAAFAVAALLTVEPLHRRGWLRWLVIVAFLAVPLIVLERDLKLSWVREFFLLELLTAVAVMIASRPLWPAREEDDDGMMRWIVYAIGGFVVAFVAIIVIILATGPSLKDVYDGVVKEAFGIRDVITGTFAFPADAAVDWGIAAVVAAALASRLRIFAAADGKPSIWPGLLRAVAGLAILLNVAHIVVFGFSPSAGNPLILAMVFAWIATIPPLGASEPPHRRFIRVLLPMLALGESLQVYPVPGSQVGIAAFCFVPVGALCLGDALADLRAWSEARGGIAPANLAATVTALAIAVPALFVLNAIVLPGVNNVYTYRAGAKLHLPGAELLRIPAPQAETYEQLVGLIHKHGCTTLIGYPSVNALYFWSELEAPRPTIPNAWMYALNDSQQEQAVRELKASPRPCAIRNEELAAPYLKALPPPDKPLVDYALNDFKPVVEVGGYVFETPLPSATEGKG
jgi:hypothetical protein